MLCKETCLLDDIIEQVEEKYQINISIEVVKQKVMDELNRVYFKPAKDFAIGSRLRREGRAPYLHLLHWLAKSNKWSIQMDDIMSRYPEYKGSVGQVVDKGYLEKIVYEKSKEITDVIHYDDYSRILSIEDPKFLFYLRNLLWTKFAKKIGYVTNLNFASKYDFALSFAGSNRDLAQNLFEKLSENELEVFYDMNEQHSILAENVEDYLAPIYKSEAEFVIVLLSKEYPKRIWTNFESNHFKDRFGENSVIPIWFSDISPTNFDESRKYGGLTFDVTEDMDEQVEYIVSILLKKLHEKRIAQ